MQINIRCGNISKFINVAGGKIICLMNYGRHKLCISYEDEELLRKMFIFGKSLRDGKEGIRNLDSFN